MLLFNSCWIQSSVLYILFSFSTCCYKLHSVIRSKCKCLNHSRMYLSYSSFLVDNNRLCYFCLSNFFSYANIHILLKKTSVLRSFFKQIKINFGALYRWRCYLFPDSAFLIKCCWLWYLRFTKMPIQWLLLQFWKLFRVEAFRLPWTDKIPSTECACGYRFRAYECKCDIPRCRIHAHGQNPR